MHTTAKCHHLKKLTYKPTLQNAFIKDYRLEIQYSQLCWYFRPSFVNCYPFPLLSRSTLQPLPVPCVISILYTRIHYYTVWGSGPRQINTCHKVPLQVNFFRDDDILHCLLWVLSFYDCLDEFCLLWARDCCLLDSGWPISHTLKLQWWSLHAFQPIRVPNIMNIKPIRI